MADLRTDDELRAAIRDGDSPERVYAAFELGRRLGSAVTADLDLSREADSGVRRHLLTILASFGERDAVRAIAECAGPEGEHAVHLAIQLGIASPGWLADRFNAASDRMRDAMLDLDGVAWSNAERALEDLLGSALADVRRRVVGRLVAIQPVPGEPLRRFAARAPDEAASVFAPWARGPDHASLLARVPLWSMREDVALRALVAAGRRYPLVSLRQLLKAYPAALALVAEPMDRSVLLAVTGERLASGGGLPPAWIDAVVRTLPSPWSPDEAAVFRRWELTVAELYAENPDWLEPYDAHQPPEQVVLEAIGWGR